MFTFSLLQVSLDQTIGRDSFLEAAAAAEEITRADLSQLHRDLFGIVVSHLSEADARALKLELDRREFPVEMVADQDLPLLPDDFQVQRVEYDDEWLRFTDTMGRVTSRSLSDLVFVAGGYLKTSKTRSEVVAGPPSRGKSPPPRSERVYRMEDVLEFRMEFFFASEPHRFKMSLLPEKVIFHQEKAVQLHKKAVIQQMAGEITRLLPPDRISRGLGDLTLVYPTFRAYLEEIRWHFHRLTKIG